MAAEVSVVGVGCSGLACHLGRQTTRPREGLLLLSSELLHHETIMIHILQSSFGEAAFQGVCLADPSSMEPTPYKQP